MYKGEQLSPSAKQRTGRVTMPKLAKDAADVVARSALGGPSVRQERYKMGAVVHGDGDRY